MLNRTKLITPPKMKQASISKFLFLSLSKTRSYETICTTKYETKDQITHKKIKFIRVRNYLSNS